MTTYRSEGIEAFRAYEAAAAEEYAVAHELAQCAKIDVYHLLAAELFEKVATARSNTLAAFTLVEKFRHE